MQFDTLTLLLLTRPADAPVVSDDEAARLQDGHLAHLAKLHNAGHLVAAGPVLAADEDDPLRGIGLFRVGPAEATALMADDPSVRAGRLATTTYPWMCPAGAMLFLQTRFPRSVADAQA